MVTTILCAIPAIARSDTEPFPPSRDRRPVPPPPAAPPPPCTTPVPPPAPLAAADVATCPRPEAASGVLVPPPPPPSRTVGRIILFVPRGLFVATMAPVRGGLALEDRWHLAERYRRWFWNDARTIGLYPVVAALSRLSFSGGAAFVVREPAYPQVHARAQVGTGSLYTVNASVDSGALLGPVNVLLGGVARGTSRAPFFGYGMVEETDDRPPAPVDPLAADLAVDTRFRYEELGARLGVSWALAPWMRFLAGGSIRRLEFSGGDPSRDELELAEVYDTTDLPGFDDGVDAVRGEIAVVLDGRERRYDWQSRAMPASGPGLHLFAGWQQDLDDQDASFPYLGFDLIQLVDLFAGDRVLSLRVVLDASLGEIDDVPFTELPVLGGRDILRGYPAGRFRDRWAAAASLQYDWPISRGWGAFLFTEAGRVGRVFPSLFEARPRVTGGVGIKAFTHERMSFLGWVGVSEDGDVTVSFQLAAGFGSRGREGS